MKKTLLAMAATATIALSNQSPQATSQQQYITTSSLDEALLKIKESKGDSATELQKDLQVLEQQFRLDNEKGRASAFDEQAINKRIDILLSHYMSIYNQQPEVKIHYPSFSYIKRCNETNCIVVATVSKELLDNGVLQLQKRDGTSKNKIAYIKSIKNVMPLSKRVNMLEQEESSIRGDSMQINNSMSSNGIAQMVNISSGDYYNGRLVIIDENTITMK